MGCDIHAIVERREYVGGEPWGWTNSGDPDIGRNYEIYAALAGVRNYDEIPVVAEPRGLPGGFQGKEPQYGWLRWEDRREMPCSVFEAYFEDWVNDAHAATWLTLAELKAYDTSVTVYDNRLITSRDEAGKVYSLCRATSGRHEGPVGPRRIFAWPGEDGETPWDRLIAYMENVRAHHDLSDDEVRLVAFFDN